MNTAHPQLVLMLTSLAFYLSGCAAKQTHKSDPTAVVSSTMKIDTVPDEQQFGPVTNVVLSSDLEGTDYVLDLDTGRVLTPDRDSAVAWKAYLCGLGADIVNEENLTGLRMCVMKLEALKDENGWDSLSAAECARRIEGLREDPNPLSDHTITWDRLPSTWLFQTREGGRGILQVIETQRQPKRVKIRYKLLQEDKP